MSNVSFFIQQCPTCGRRLQVKLDYLGKKVACQHCQAQFIANQSESAGESFGYNAFSVESNVDDLLNKADQYLSSAETEIDTDLHIN